MKLRYYTDKELEILNNNMFVLSVRYKREIEYDVVFKLWCVMMRLKNPELTGKQIFEQGGFDTSILHESLPYRRIADWVKNYRKFGLYYFIPDLLPYHSLENKKESLDKNEAYKLRLLRDVLFELKKMEGKI